MNTPSPPPHTASHSSNSNSVGSSNHAHINARSFITTTTITTPSSTQVTSFLTRLQEAVETDQRDVKKGTFAPHAVSRMIEEIRSLIHWSSQETEQLLNAGLLTTLRKVFQTVAGRSIVPNLVKAEILRTLMVRRSRKE